jgi:RHS repeat-associated protein
LVRKTKPGLVRHYLWESDNLLAELDSAGTEKVAEYSYYPGLDNPHALIVDNKKYFAHRDIVGNVIALTDSSQVLARTYEYTAFGRSWNGTDYAGLAGRDRARFKGALSFGDGVEDLYYMRNRWYEPRSGRFLSEDPIGPSGGLNRYVFVGNDPVNGRDPTGLTRTCTIYGTITYWYYPETGAVEIISVTVDRVSCSGDVDEPQGGGSGDPLLCSQTVAGQQITTRSSVAADARAFINELAANGFDAQVGPNSSYRNDIQQTVLYHMYLLYRDSGIDLGVHVAAPPGSSNHQGGYDVDINSFQNWSRFSTSQRWLIQSIAGRNGFTQPVTADPVHFEHMSAPRTRAGIQSAIAEARASDTSVGACP